MHGGNLTITEPSAFLGIGYPGSYREYVFKKVIFWLESFLSQTKKKTYLTLKKTWELGRN